MRIVKRLEASLQSKSSPCWVSQLMLAKLKHSDCPAVTRALTVSLQAVRHPSHTQSHKTPHRTRTQLSIAHPRNCKTGPWNGRWHSRTHSCRGPSTAGRRTISISSHIAMLMANSSPKCCMKHRTCTSVSGSSMASLALPGAAAATRKQHLRSPAGHSILPNIPRTWNIMSNELVYIEAD